MIGQNKFALQTSTETRVASGSTVHMYKATAQLFINAFYLLRSTLKKGGGMNLINNQISKGDGEIVQLNTVKRGHYVPPATL